MSDYPAAAGVTRQNILARLLGGDPIQQLPAAPVAPGPQMTAGDPGFVPGIAPRMNIMARLLGEPLTTPQAERDAYRDALNAAGWAGSSAPGRATPQAIRAYHAAYEPFDAFDWSRLGAVTRPNVEGMSIERYAMNLAELGPWANSASVARQMAAPHTLPVDVLGRGRRYNSLDQLSNAVTRAGGPAALRERLTAQGYGHVVVPDGEFGGTSYVGLSPETWRIAPR